MLAYVMAHIRPTIKAVIRNERGATAVEYGLMVALIAAVIIGAVTALGTNASTKFQNVADAILNAGG